MQTSGLPRLPRSLRPRHLPWWHWASLLGLSRRLIERAHLSVMRLVAKDRYVTTLTGTIMWRQPDGVNFTIELVHYDLFVKHDQRFFRYRNGRLARSQGENATTHPLYPHVMDWAAGFEDERFWRQAGRNSQGQAAARLAEHYGR